MHFVTQEFRNTLRALVAEGVAIHGLRGFARELDIDMGPVRSARDETRDIHLSSAMLILDRLGYEAVIRRKGQRDPPSFGFSEQAQSLVTASAEDSPEALRFGYRSIPYHDICGDVRDPAAISVARSWVEDRGLDIEALCWVIAPDDRMSPIVSSGALCLVEQQRTLPEPPSVTALRHQGQLVLAHVTRPTGGDWLLNNIGPGSAIYVPASQAAATLPIGRIVATFTIIDTTKGD